MQVTSHVASSSRAELFLARGTEADGSARTLMVKQLKTSQDPSDLVLESFLEEARIATLLSHPSVVRPLDVGEYHGCFFFTMDHIEGADVRSLVQRVGRLSLRAALAIVTQAARALHQIHEQRDEAGRNMGIVHRNLAPSNLLVSEDGDVRLIDFGHEQKTRDQVLRGELSYMAPELCCLDAVDRRADVFSLGILLWELTTGARLFVGESERVIRQKVCVDPIPPPSSMNPQYPSELEGIVMRALERNPASRFPNAGELAEALENFGRRNGLAMTRAELSSYVQECLERHPAPMAPPAEQPAPAPRPVVAAVSSSYRQPDRMASRALSATGSAAEPAQSSKAANGQKRRSLVGPVVIAVLLLGSASVAAALFLMPGVETKASQGDVPATQDQIEGDAPALAQPVSGEEPARSASSDPGSGDDEGESEVADGPIPLDVKPNALAAQEAKRRSRSTRRNSDSGAKDSSDEALEEKKDEPKKSSVASFAADLEKKRKRKTESKSGIASFNKDVEKRKKPRKRRKAKPRKKKKKSAASALLPSQR